MKKSSYLTIALVVVLLLLAAGAWISFGGSAGFEYANADKYTAGETTVSSRVEDLDIHWTDGKVNFIYHDGEGISISETSKRNLSEDDRLRWWLDGTTLRIRYAKSGLRLTANLEKELTVSLPKDLKLKTVSAEATSADMKLDGLAADEIRLQSTSGDIRGTAEAGKLTAGSTSGDLDLRQDGAMESAEAGSTSGKITLALGDVKTLKASTTSGSIRVEAAAAGKVKIGSTSGSVTVRAGTFEELKIGTTSGEVTAELPEAPGFTCEAETVSGAFNSSIALVKDGRRYVCGDGSGKCSIGTTSGNITIGKIN